MLSPEELIEIERYNFNRQFIDLDELLPPISRKKNQKKSYFFFSKDMALFISACIFSFFVIKSNNKFFMCQNNYPFMLVNII